MFSLQSIRWQKTEGYKYIMWDIQTGVYKDSWTWDGQIQKPNACIFIYLSVSIYILISHKSVYLAVCPSAVMYQSENLTCFVYYAHYFFLFIIVCAVQLLRGKGYWIFFQQICSSYNLNIFSQLLPLTLRYKEIVAISKRVLPIFLVISKNNTVSSVSLFVQTVYL